MKMQLTNKFYTRGFTSSKLLVLFMISIVVAVMSLGLSSVLLSTLTSNSPLMLSINPSNELDNNFYRNENHNEIIKMPRIGIDSEQEIYPTSIRDSTVENYDSSNQFEFESEFRHDELGSEQYVYVSGFETILEEQRLYVNKTLLQTLLKEINLDLYEILEEHQIQFLTSQNQDSFQHFYMKVAEDCYESIFFQVSVCERISIMTYQISTDEVSFIFEKIIFEDINKIKEEEINSGN